MSEQIYVVLIPLAADALLLPNSAVAEVTVQERMEPAESGAPEWLAGWYSLPERRVPVVSFEALNGAPRPPANRRARLLLVHSFGTRLHGSQFALLTQGHPHLITLGPEAVSGLPLRTSDQAGLILSRVRLATQEAAVPDLEAVESVLAQALATV
jgi:chemosensory pili system protein ChpC